MKDILRELIIKLNEKFGDAFWLVIQANTGADGKSGNKLRTYTLIKTPLNAKNT